MQILASSVFKIKGLDTLIASLDGGTLPALISGAGPVHRASVAAGLRLETRRPLFVISQDISAAEIFARDLRVLLGESAALLTAREFTFYSAEGVSREAEQQRISALDGLSSRDSPVCVCTAEGLLQRAAPPGWMRRLSFTLDKKGPSVPEDIEDALIRGGYVRCELVEGRGQFARRGGIIDFFSPGSDAPVRVEFWGDEIDTMGVFDPVSQRRTEEIERARILPAAEVLQTAFPGGAAAFAEELGKLADRINMGAVRFDARKLKENLRGDSERLRAGVRLASADRYMGILFPEISTALDYIPKDAIVFLDQPTRLAEKAEAYTKRLSQDVAALIEEGVIPPRLADFALDWGEALEKLSDFPLVMGDSFTVGRIRPEPRRIIGITAKQLPSYGGSAETAAEDVKAYLSQGFSVVVLAGDKRRAETLAGVFERSGIKAPLSKLAELPEPGRCVIGEGALSSGFEYRDLKLAVLTDTQFMQEGALKARRKKALSGRGSVGSCADLSVGDLVVHEYYGIGRFAGVVTLQVEGADKDYMKVCFAGTDSLYVPATQLDLVSKYIGGGEDKQVKLSKMGGADWTRAKSRAKAAAKELASGLIKLYAQRQSESGHAFAKDSPWQKEFEERFPYVETDDQLRCTEEIKKDMERPSPMDRLLCGDVGYGKTEVALRAVMKCVLDGKQAAILVPTTVLAQQHYQTAAQRFFGYPIRIDVLSRFCAPAEVKSTLAAIKTGECDIAIGTHRLLQRDIAFRKLGLLVVDEEQRFGVSHKEHIKELSRGVDVLTLSATPIPRTLNMALSGIRDMSTIEEPPADRQPVQTFVMEHDWNVVCDAIRREVSRGGQVYYLHNRIETISRCASRLREMLPGVGISLAHGRMTEEELSSVMEKMTDGGVQVLVCTTIIETGIDIPNVNTLIIEDADKLGLAQLHQIRGRVGRSSRRATAYFTFRRDKVLTEVAEKRLRAIQEFAEFGSGFKIAMRDLEIRGAGNLLGAEQSGHMIDVGYDMYLKLLEEAVREEKGEPAPIRAECSADLSVSANLPESYVLSPEQRMDIYRRIALIRSEDEADDLLDELIDRFGDPPPEAVALVNVALLRGEAGRAGIADISQKAGSLLFVLREFDMERVSALYARPEYKGRVKVEAGSKPCLRLKLRSPRIIDEARGFVSAWAATAAPAEAALKAP